MRRSIPCTNSPPARIRSDPSCRESGDQPARTATLELRFAEVRMPLPRVLTPWLREHRPAEPLRLWVVEVRETQPPASATPLRWVLFTMEPVTTIAAANAMMAWYERRPMIEDYHKALKTRLRRGATLL